jgi:hypothetical protein
LGDLVSADFQGGIIRMKKLSLSAIVAVLLLSCSVTFALDPMGSAGDKLRKGQFGVGVEYSESDIDFKAKGKSVLVVYDVAGSNLLGIQSEKQRLALSGVEMRKTYAAFGYGVTDNLEAFMRVGAADTEWRDDGDTHLSLGLRTGVTLYEKDSLKFNALAQYSWAESDFDSLPLTTIVGSTPYPLKMSGSLSLHEIQISMGPTYELSEGVSIYGGGFFHLMDGSLDLKGSITTTGIPQFRYDMDSSYDIDQVSELGIYIGTRIKTANNISYGIEYQHTNSADAIAMRLLWRF